MKRIIRALPLLIILFCAPLLFGETIIDQASLQLASDVAVARANGIFLESVDEELLVAYQGASAIQLGRLSDDGWSAVALPISGSAILQGFAADGQLLVFGYIEERALWTLSSLDGGRTFLSPTRIAVASQAPSIQGMAIDEMGTIHLLFHRHDRFWDLNYASSTNQGRSYSVRNAFTRLTDSSSTGYSGSLSAIHTRLYTVYQDTNNRNMIKLGISENGGQGWQIQNLLRTSGGVLAFAVDPRDGEQLYIGSIDTEALRILKVSAASSEAIITPLYEDRTVNHSAARQASVHIGISGDGELIVTYLNGARSAYEVLVSQDGGERWVQERLEGAIQAEAWRQGASLKVWGDEPMFVRSDGEGTLLLHGFATEGGDEQSFDLEMDLLTVLGIATITDPHKAFTVTYDEEMKIVMLVASQDGAHELYHADQATMPVTMIISSTAEGDDEVIWNLDDDFNFIDRSALSVESGITYMLVTSLLHEEDLGKSATFILRPVGDSPATPVAPLQSGPTVLQIEAPAGARVKAGHFSSFIISKRGDLYASGLSDQGQLGQGSLASIKEFPMLIRYSKDATAGFAHSLFLSEDGRLMVSGRNDEYQLGDGTTTRRTSPFVLASNVIDMAAGYAHTLFVKKDGSLWGAGSNASGQLGIGTTSVAPTPVKVMDGIARVWANSYHSSFALTSDGVLYGWGENGDGQLGTGDRAARSKPTYITSQVVSVAPGANFTLVLKDDGSLWATGENSNRQLGTKELDSSLRLVKVADGVVSIAAGGYTSFYIDTQARLWAAGSNQYGQWGNGTTANTSATGAFTHVLSDVKEVDCGARHAIALKRDGTVWTAGANGQQQLGDQSEGFRSTWKQVFQVVD